MSWSDITSKNVSYDKQLSLEIDCMSLECSNYLESLRGHQKKMINPRNMDNGIQYSGTDSGQTDGDYINPYRKRKIPSKKIKKYPVKPKLDYKKENKLISHL